MRKVDASAERALARHFWVITWFAQRLDDRQPFAGNHYRLTGVSRPKRHWRPVSDGHPCGIYWSWLPRTLSVEPKTGLVVVKTDELNMGDARA